MTLSPPCHQAWPEIPNPLAGIINVCQHACSYLPSVETWTEDREILPPMFIFSTGPLTPTSFWSTAWTSTLQSYILCFLGSEAVSQDWGSLTWAGIWKMATLNSLQRPQDLSAGTDWILIVSPENHVIKFAEQRQLDRVPLQFNTQPLEIWSKTDKSKYQGNWWFFFLICRFHISSQTPT